MKWTSAHPCAGRGGKTEVLAMWIGARLRSPMGARCGAGRGSDDECLRWSCHRKPASGMRPGSAITEWTDSANCVGYLARVLGNNCREVRMQTHLGASVPGGTRASPRVVGDPPSSGSARHPRFGRGQTPCPQAPRRQSHAGDESAVAHLTSARSRRVFANGPPNRLPSHQRPAQLLPETGCVCVRRFDRPAAH
jgi:hypothetical protein